MCRWDQRIEEFRLPRGLGIALADSVVGTSTPKMVSRVLQWKKESPKDSLELFQQLDGLNASVVDSFRKLSVLSLEMPKEYNWSLEYIRVKGIKDARVSNEACSIMADIWQNFIVRNLYLT